MRLLLGLFVTSITLGCASEAVVRGAGGNPQGGQNGEPEQGADGPCAAAPAATVLSASILGRGSIDLTRERVAFGFVDTKGVPTVLLRNAVGGEETLEARFATAPVAYERYGAGYITTSLAHNGDRFGFGWYTERPLSSSGGVWSTMFATLSAADASTSSPTKGNDDTGRRGPDDLVQARLPSVAPFGDGFLMAWDDTRTKEPVTTGTNLSNWGGIYARTYSATGQGQARDVQIAQPTSKLGFAGVTDGAHGMAIWTRIDPQWNATVHARAGTTFAPAEAPKPVAEVVDYDGRAPVAAALGADGDVLLVVGRNTSQTGEPGAWKVGTMKLTMTGAAKTSYADWKEGDLANPSVFATEDGYVVAAHEVDAEGATSALRFFWLDLEGNRLKEARSELVADRDHLVSQAAIWAKGDTVRAAVLVEPVQAESGAAEVKLLTVCAP